MTLEQPADKVLDRVRLVDRYGRSNVNTREATGSRRRIVFTNGVFDLLHRGHVEYLFAARALGDVLVVGMNTDASVRRLKGPARPVNNENDRAIVLAGLACVDAISLFDEDTPSELIRALVPDILVKGADYAPDQVVGRDIVEAAGGHLVLIPLVEGRSTTSIIQRMQEEQS
jgi:D-beta-D-heptose 7-phosphate kinase/D-beta-D-heptose 1-phosphate adenosyltransferase